MLRRCIIPLLLVLGMNSIAAARQYRATYNFDQSSERWANQAPFDENSSAEWGLSLGRSGGGLHVKGAHGDPDQMRRWLKVIFDAPKERALRFSAWIKGKGVENVAVFAVQAHDRASHHIVAFATTQVTSPLRGDFDWTRVQTILSLPPETVNIQVLLMLVGDGEVWFDDVEIEELAPAPAAVPGLFSVIGLFAVVTEATSGEPCKILVPLPAADDRQAPMEYKLIASPPDRMTSVRLVEHGAAGWAVELTVQPGEDSVSVSWNCKVLVRPTKGDEAPTTAPTPSGWPEDAAAWLAGSRSVQKDDPRFAALAGEIRGDEADVMRIIERALTKQRAILMERNQPATGSDALSSLTGITEAVGDANLLAAILRACGVPTRVCASYSVDVVGSSPAYTVEAYVPGYGWYGIEPTRMIHPWRGANRVRFDVVSIDDENASAARQGADDGVPYLSTIERAPGSGAFSVIRKLGMLIPPAGGVTSSESEAPGGTPQEWDAVIADAGSRWREWIRSKPSGTSLFKPILWPLLETKPVK